MGPLHEALAPGSHLAATHVTTEGHAPAAVEQIEAAYAATPTPIFFRGKADIGLFFDGLELVDPGLVTIDTWNPEDDETDKPAKDVGKWLYGGIGRKS